VIKMLFDPFGPFDAFFAAPGSRTGFVPPADVTVSDHDLVLTVDLPGLTADDLDIQFDDGYLTLKGQRKRPEVGDGTTWAHAERAYGTFERRVRLPDAIDPDTITASMDNGVLSLIVPKPDRLRPRTIQIAGGAAREELEEAVPA
jgi:HSP20 family protein